MALSTTNNTISGGSCASYGGAASGVKRSCGDCLHYAVTSEAQVQRTALILSSLIHCRSPIANDARALFQLLLGLHVHCE